MSIENQILLHMAKLSSPKNRLCFTPKHFIQFGTYSAIKKALERLVKANKIRRVTRGIYDLPYKSKLGIRPPDISKVVESIAFRDKIRVQPTGAQAANMLGLSEQVPSKIIYLTDGRSKKIKVDKTMIIFQPAAVKDMNYANSLFGLIVQALKYLKKEHIDDVVIKKIKRIIVENPKEDIKGKLSDSPIWIIELFKEKIFKE